MAPGTDPASSSTGGGGGGGRCWPLLWLLLAPPLVLMYLLLSRDGALIEGANYLGVSTLTRSEHRQQQPPPLVIARPAAARTPSADTREAAEDGPITLDVVYCINLPEDTTSFKRIDYGAIASLFRQTVRHLVNDSIAAPAVRFHLLSNDDDAIARMRAVHPALHVHDYRVAAASARSDAFLQHYVHQSVNAVEYERLCMWRWIAMADYFKQLQQAATNVRASPPRFIVGIDTDVALFQPPTRLLSAWKLQHWIDQGFDCHENIKGAAMVWSPKGLESFADFLDRAYTSPKEATRLVKTFGERFPSCKPERSLLLPCNASAADPKMLHVSDMVRGHWIVAIVAFTKRKRARTLTNNYICVFLPYPAHAECVVLLEHHRAHPQHGGEGSALHRRVRATQGGRVASLPTLSC